MPLSSRRRLGPSPWAFALGTAVSVLHAPVASADEPEPREAATCTDSFASAQSLRDDGRLRAARAELLVCAQEPCPEVLRRKCREWLEVAAVDIPSLVVRVREADRRSPAAATVSIDGIQLETPLGDPVEVDPGAHRVRAELDGRSLEVEVVLVRGEKRRPVEIRLPAPRSARARRVRDGLQSRAP